jgi:cyclohexa-1,5-dienecarbonyl-CoA hydratase
MGRARAERRENGQVLHLLLDAPRANVLDEQMIVELTHALDSNAGDERLKAIVFEGAGANFCFGASVAEHTRERAPAMLCTLDTLFLRLATLAVPTVAVVRGACLGGGFELAAWCSFLFASPDASFGLPEIKLGVFPPLGSLILPWRLGGGRGLDLCVTGRTVDAHEALDWGLVREVVEDPAQAAARFVAENLLPRSASSLRFVERAARQGLVHALDAALPGIERLYLDELMQTPDANEGIAAFLEKRPPRWAQP